MPRRRSGAQSHRLHVPVQETYHCQLTGMTGMRSRRGEEFEVVRALDVKILGRFQFRILAASENMIILVVPTWAKSAMRRWTTRGV